MMLIYSCYQGIYLLADFKNVDINVNGMHIIRSMSRFAVLGEIFVSKMLTCYKVNKKTNWSFDKGIYPLLMVFIIVNASFYCTDFNKIQDLI